MKYKYKASLCILSYMHEKYIEDALKSVLAQSCKEFEVLILDDASSDKTVSIIENNMSGLKASFPNVVFIKHEVNTGNIPANLNEMIEKSSGEYIMGISGDDIMLLDYAETLIKQLDEHQDAMVVHANGFVEYEDYHFGDRLNWNLKFERTSGYERDDFFHMMLYGPQILAPATIRRRRAYDIYGMYDETVGYEDYDFWLRLASSGERFYYLEKPVVVYRRCITSISNRDTGDVETKLIFCINAEINTKNKYNYRLTEEDAIKVWSATFNYLYSECKRINSTKCMDELEKAFPSDFRDKIITVTSVEPPSSEKLNHESFIMSKWVDNKKTVDEFISDSINTNKTIAIFGFSRIGNRLLGEIDKQGGSVKYIVDRKGQALYAHVPVYIIDDDLPEVDIVFVTAMGAYDSVCNMLSDKTGGIIIDFERMVCGDM